MSFIYNSLSYLASATYNTVYGTTPVEAPAPVAQPAAASAGSSHLSASADRADLLRAIQASLAAPAQRPSVSHEDDELERAIQASLAAAQPAASSESQQWAADVQKAQQASLHTSQNHYVPQVGDKIPMAAWIASLKDNEYLKEQLENLAVVYKFVQPIGGDGNCFYISFAMHMLLGFGSLKGEQKAELMRQFEGCAASMPAKHAVATALRSLLNGTDIRAEDALMRHFVECLRALGVQYVQEHRHEFFFDEEYTYEHLIANLRKMGECAEEPMIIAVVKALRYPVRVVRAAPKLANARGAAGTFDYNVEGRVIRQGAEPHRVLLFTDGHYQLLSKK